MKVLGIDVGTSTGWAFVDSDTKQIENSGTEDFTKKRGESNGLIFLRWRVWFTKMVEFHYPNLALVCYERQHHRGGYAVEFLLGLQTQMTEVCAVKKILLAPCHSMSLKKFATGSGRASKEDMMREAIRYLGWEPGSSDEADAIHLCYWALKEYSDDGT